MEQIITLIQRVFANDDFTILELLSKALVFVLGVICAEYKMKKWFHHRRVWSRLAVCLVLIIVAVYFDWHVVAVVIFAALVVVSAVAPLPHEWLLMFYYKSHHDALKTRKHSAWMVTTSGLLRFYEMKIKACSGLTLRQHMTLQQFIDDWNNDNDRLLVHTSGSTGAPKPLWVEKKRMEASARTTCRFLGLKAGDTALLCMPLDYIAGKMMVVRSIVAGLQLISVKPSGHPLAGLASAPTFAAMVPMQVYNSLQVPQERDLLRKTKHLIIGGGAIDEQLAKELRTFPNAVWSTYGMTETLSHIALRRLSGSEASEWYSPFDGVSISTDSEGCLIINAPEVCKHPLITNDITRMSPDGKQFRIIGRRDNVICSGGIKLQIEEIEAILRPHLPHPFIITKVPDEKFGEAVVLLTTAPDLQPIRSLCSLHLSRFQTPKHFFTVPAIPTTETGKPARTEAARMAHDRVRRRGNEEARK